MLTCSVTCVLLLLLQTIVIYYDVCVGVLNSWSMPQTSNAQFCLYTSCYGRQVTRHTAYCVA